jgi:hypothetical protein
MKNNAPTVHWSIWSGLVSAMTTWRERIDGYNHFTVASMPCSIIPAPQGLLLLFPHIGYFQYGKGLVWRHESFSHVISLLLLLLFPL